MLRYFKKCLRVIRYYNKGINLIEILIASSILILASTAFLPVFSFVNKSSVNNKNRLTASTLSSSVLEEIRALNYDDVGIIGGNPEGLIPQEQIKTIDGIDFKIRTDVSWASAIGKNEQLNEMAYKKVKVTVLSQNIFTGNIEKVDEVSSIVTKEGGEILYKEGGISVIIKNVKNELYIDEQFTVNITNEPDPPIENKNCTLDTEGGEVYFGILPEGNYKVKIKIPDGLSPMYGEIIENGWVVRRNVSVVDWQTTQVVVYMDVEDNLCGINLNMLNSKTNEYIDEEGLVTLIWNMGEQSVRVIDKKQYTPSDFEDIIIGEYTHQSSLKPNFFGRLSPKGEYNIIIEEIEGYRTFDTELGGLIKTHDLRDWDGVFSEAGQEVFITSLLKPEYYYYTLNPIKLGNTNSGIIGISDTNIYDKVPRDNSSGNAFDNNLDTAWTIIRIDGNEKIQSTCIDLGEGNEKQIGKVKITLSTDYKFHWSLYGSNNKDNINNQIFKEENISSKDGVFEIDLVPKKIPEPYRYYKLEVKLTQSNKSSVVDIFEIDFFKHQPSDYETNKEFISGPFGLDRYSPAPEFTINWDVDIPAKTSYKIYTGITYSSEIPPSGWSEVYTNGQSIPGINKGDDLIGKYIWIKEVLTSSDGSATPQRNWLNIYYDE